MHHSASLMPPPSPFCMQLAPSPRESYIPYPSPGMYPSPLLPPRSESQLTNSSSHFRGSSGGATNTIDVAGTLTPGHFANGFYPNGLYPEIAMGTMSLGSPAAPTIPGPSPSPNATQSDKLLSSDLRRLSIVSSVLKKKVQTKSGSESGESSSNRGGSELNMKGIESINESGNAAGNGDDKGVSSVTTQLNGNYNSAEGSASSSSYPASPLQQPHRQIIISFDNAGDLPHNGTTTPESPGLTIDLGESETVSGREHDSQFLPDDLSHHKSASHSDREQEELDSERVLGEPVFASLAHTPDQLGEIARMRESAQRAQRGRRRLGEAGPAGMAILPFTPSPSKSPAPLRRG